MKKGNNKMIDINRFFSEVAPKMGNKNKILEELVENAVRANASTVSFEFTEDNTLVVQNDGDILKDFSSLLIVARSSYENTEIEKTHRPAGMGIMMMLSACESIIFESGNSSLSVISEMFFTSAEYRQNVLSTVTTDNAEIQGMRMKLKFENNYQFLLEKVLNSRFSDTVSIESLGYYDMIDIYVQADCKEIPKQKVEGSKISSHFSKAGDGNFQGCEIFVSDSSFRNKGAVIWFGKMISAEALSPFIIKVNGKFDLLHPVLPDRTELIDEDVVIKDVKKKIEEFLDDEIQKLLPTLTSDQLSRFLLQSTTAYNLNHFNNWFGLKKEDQDAVIYDQYALCSSIVRVNRASFIEDSEELIDVDIEYCEGLHTVPSIIGQTEAPSWVLERMRKNNPIVEITQSEQAKTASNYGDYYDLSLCEKITIDGLEMTSIQIDYSDEYYFTEEHDFSDFIQRKYENSEYSSEDEILEGVEETCRKIFAAYSKKECKTLLFKEILHAVGRTHNLDWNEISQLKISSIDMSNNEVIIVTDSNDKKYEIYAA